MERFREEINLHSALLGNQFLVVAGNQPISSEHISRMISLARNRDDIVVSLYNKKISNEIVFVGLDNQIVKDGEEFVLQHPFIITSEVINKQKI